MFSPCFARLLALLALGRLCFFSILSCSMDCCRTLRRVFLLAAACLAIPAILPHLLSYSDLEPGSGFWVKRLDLSMVGQLSLLSFLVYEVTVGIFWPTMMKLRAEVSREMRRARANKRGEPGDG